MIKDASTGSKNHLQASELDTVVIQDGPSVYSVDSAAEPAMIEEAHAVYFEPDHNTTVKDHYSMIEKLKGEISHLENWLSHQQSGKRHSSLSVANTIRTLIATRRSLLENIENRIRKL